MEDRSFADRIGYVEKLSVFLLGSPADEFYLCFVMCPLHKNVTIYININDAAKCVAGISLFRNYRNVQLIAGAYNRLESTRSDSD